MGSRKVQLIWNWKQGYEKGHMFSVVILGWCCTTRNTNAQQAGITHSVSCLEAWWRVETTQFFCIERILRGGVPKVEEQVWWLWDGSSQLIVTPGPLISHKCVGWEGQDDLKSSFSLVCCYSQLCKSHLCFSLPWLRLQYNCSIPFAASNIRLLLLFCGGICARSATEVFIN